MFFTAEQTRRLQKSVDSFCLLRVILYVFGFIVANNMFLTTKSQYAVAALVELLLSIQQLDHSSGRKNVTLLSIASKLQLDIHYLEKIFSQLKNSGIVTAVKGHHGGYSLAKPEVNLADIMQAVQEQINLTRCKKDPRGCFGEGTLCNMHQIWVSIEEKILRIFECITLQHIFNLSYHNDGSYIL